MCAQQPSNALRAGVTGPWGICIDEPRRYVSVRPLNCDDSGICATPRSPAMSDAELLETQLPTAPTTPSGAAAEELPDDLLREATQRLGILAAVWAGLFLTGIVMNDVIGPLLDMPMRDLIPWGRPADVVGVLSIALSVWLWRYTRGLSCRPGVALDLALGYEVLLAL